MTGFSAEWLTLREPHDLRARNSTVIEAVAKHIAIERRLDQFKHHQAFIARQSLQHEGDIGRV